MKTVLITRPEPEAGAFAADLPEGWRAILSPLIEIVPTSLPPDLAGITGLIFTSRNAVKAARPHLSGTDLPAFCVGDRSAEAARAIGLEAISAGGDIAALQHLLVRSGPTGRLLHLRGRHSAGQLAGWTGLPGCEIADHILYDQRALPLTDKAVTALAAGRIDAIALFSPRSARILASQTDPEHLRRLRLLCLSRNVAEALGPLPGNTPEIAARPDRAAMLELFRR